MVLYMHTATCRRWQHADFTQSLFGSQDQLIDSMAQESSPHTAAVACADPVPALVSASFAEPACDERRFFEAGAQTTRHDIVQSTGIEQLLWIDISTVSSSLSV